MTTDLSLYRIDETLAQLLMLREEMAKDGEDTAEVEKQIAEYMEALPAKVSGVCAIFRMWKSQVAAIKAEEERLYGLRKRVEAHEARLKGYVAEILERQPEPAKGSKKLAGADGSALILKGKGGVQPLQYNSEKLPAEYCDVTVTMTWDTWRCLCHQVKIEILGQERTEPSHQRIREALAQPCPACGGKGFDQAPGYGDETCESCGGTGKQGVPGATLLPRGSHVEIR
jgi:hypothetical protein